ncbi:hypothetical protein [Synechococcus sp. PROS-9-1]|uniref:hypothetical protein n=1 Tax=Synechococcus sp. PROS-9-1 TaxID=1968775 RepID=UPI001644BDDE|nr:hypothetical protein [Synechococcus sp. PROS-9-1]
MKYENISAQEYIVWIVHTMTAMDDGPEFDQLQEHFNKICEQLDHLRNCYELPSYETDRRNQPGS